MAELPTYGNAVVYSEKAWAVARRASGGDDIWFADCGAHARGAMPTAGLLKWADDWVEMVPRRRSPVADGELRAATAVPVKIQRLDEMENKSDGQG